MSKELNKIPNYYHYVFNYKLTPTSDIPLSSPCLGRKPRFAKILICEGVD